MASRQHRYAVTVEWTGNRGAGTADYRSYDRDHDVRSEAGTIAGSADRAFRGDASRWNPEQLLLAAASQCHMLSYLHHAAVNGVVVTDYVDHPTAVLSEDNEGRGAITTIMLRPVVTILDADKIELAERLHQDANRSCFIASSLALPVEHEPRTVVDSALNTVTHD